MGVQSFGNPGAVFRSRFGRTGKRAANPVFSATGGNVVPSATTGNGYTYHVFTTSGSLVISGDYTKNIEYLVIAGGGSGGFVGGSAGGGGAGGFKTNVPGHPYAAAALPLGSGSYPVSIGAGGAGQPDGVYPAPTSLSNSGNPSTFHTITSTGGGGGGSGGTPPLPTSGTPGGSAGGGGGAGWTGVPSSGGSASPPGQGNNGGDASATAYCYASGGGGGAGSAGATASPGVPAPGGSGSPIPAFAYPIIQPGIPVPMRPTFGPAVGPTGLYAGGGGGGVYNWDPRAGGINCFPAGVGNGGPGGGGVGGLGSNVNPSPQPSSLAGNGVNGTGGGGGGSGRSGPNPGNSGSGGDGIVIIRYLA